jgi:hypothetical protein
MTTTECADLLAELNKIRGFLRFTTREPRR